MAGGRARAVTITFEELPAAPSSVAGTPVPAASQLTTQYASLGVLFDSLGGFASVVDMGAYAPSPPNAIAASTTDGLLTYGVPIYITFVSPSNPSIPATTNSVSIQGDTLISGLGTNTLIALDVNGNPLNYDIQIEPPASTLTILGAGIHELVLIGSGSTAFDNLTYSSVVIVPEPASVALLGCAALALAVYGLRRRAKSGTMS